MMVAGILIAARIINLKQLLTNSLEILTGELNK